MAPRDPFRVPLRWEFVPEMVGADRQVCWRWRAFTQSGTFHAASAESFETFSECLEDAKQHGYMPPG